MITFTRCSRVHLWNHHKTKFSSNLWTNRPSAVFSILCTQARFVTNFVTIGFCNRMILFSYFVNEIYATQVDLSTNTLHDLLDCAALYQLPSLLDECAAFMVKRVSFSNAAYLFSLADRYSLYSVREAFADLVRLHFTSFITDHCELFLALPASFLINVLECEKVGVKQIYLTN